MWGQIFNKKLASWNLQKGENYIILGKSQGKEQKCQPSLTVNLGVLETSKITLVLFGYENIISSLFGQRNIIMIIFGQSDSGTEWKSSGNLFSHQLDIGGEESNQIPRCSNFAFLYRIESLGRTYVVFSPLTAVQFVKIWFIWRGLTHTLVGVYICKCIGTRT